jgi:hypothetical protein
MAKKGGEVVVDVSANTSKLDNALKASEDAFDNLGESSKKALEGADQLTGGLASSIYKGVQSVGAMVKGMGLLKVALISTGIGAIAVAVGTLAAYFTQTAEGAAMLQVVTQQLGAIFHTIIQRIADLGGAIVKLFSGDFEGAARDAKAAVTGIGEEIKQVSAAQAALTRATQALARAQNGVTVETAKSRAEIERLKGLSDDTTKSINERIQAAEKASGMESKLLQQRVANAKEELRIARESLHGRQASVEEARNLADLEAEVYNLQAESSTLQTELRNKINGLRAEQKAAAEERKAQAQEEKEQKAAQQAELDEELRKNEEKRIAAQDRLERALWESTASEIDKEVRAIEDKYNELEALAIENGLATEEIEKQRIAAIEALEERQRATKAQKDQEARDAQAKAQADADAAAQQKRKEKNDQELAEEAALQQAKKQVAVGSLQALAALSDAFTKGDEKRAERNFKINKAIGLANAVINTAEGITAALTDKTQPSTILRIAQTAIVAATGLAQIATISKQTWPPKDTQAPPPPGASGGGGSMGSSAPQIDLSFMNGSQTSGFRSYVLASDVSNAQQANQKIKEQASLVG